jgi:hypothetical protein
MFGPRKKKLNNLVCYIYLGFSILLIGNIILFKMEQTSTLNENKK